MRHRGLCATGVLWWGRPRRARSGGIDRSLHGAEACCHASGGHCFTSAGSFARTRAKLVSRLVTFLVRAAGAAMPGVPGAPERWTARRRAQCWPGSGRVVTPAFLAHERGVLIRTGHGSWGTVRHRGDGDRVERGFEPCTAVYFTAPDSGATCFREQPFRARTVPSRVNAPVGAAIGAGPSARMVNCGMRGRDTARTSPRSATATRPRPRPGRPAPASRCGSARHR
jgi:hypothetical protein